MDSVVDGVVAIARFPGIGVVSIAAFEIVISLSSVEDVAAVISIELVVPLAAELDVVHRISALQGIIAVCSSAYLRQLVHFIVFEYDTVVKDDLV